MTSTVLVAYATRYGSTREVADAVGNRLRAASLEVDVRPVDGVDSLDGYTAVVIGAPFYIGSMLGEARKFVERNQTALGRMPVAVFALGPISNADDPEEARTQLDQALAKLSWLQPVATEMFVGKYDPARLRLADRLIAALPASPLHGLPARDDRDWAAIAAWADTLPAALGVGV